ncbi:MAG: hypothetical protein H7A51_19895 [Akkermansiaceae bacterium]|nr:hypothetical protein [Akkermansiaceae bacterium]
MTKSNNTSKRVQGFALIATISVMVLLVMIALAMLSLSAIEMRNVRQGDAVAEARANARMALMLAIGDIQGSLGPDTRISASASILDSNDATPATDGVKHPHLLGVWQSWGAWLNARAEAPDGSSLAIADTYAPSRPPMFRKWLVSLDAAQAGSLAFAKTGTLDDAASVELVGEGSVIDSLDHVRAGLLTLQAQGKVSGRMAWWVGGENQKADITRNTAHTPAAAAVAELAHGNGTATDLSGMDGLSLVARDGRTAARLISTGELPVAGADRAVIGEGLHDFTAHGVGLMTDVRWGGLKKDLSLLFNRPTLPPELTRSATTAFSPRPLSADLLAYNPKIPERGFTSFEQMHAFARQYKDTSNWAGAVPSAKTQAYGEKISPAEPEGFYRRMPVISKFYSIYNLQTARVGKNDQGADTYDCYLTYSPVVQLWNPYNVPLEIDEEFTIHTLPYKIMPVRFKTYKRINGSSQPFTTFAHWNYWVGADYGLDRGFGFDFESPFQTSGGSSHVTLGSGEFMMFSFKTRLDGGIQWGAANAQAFQPGFDPEAAGSARLKVLSAVTRDEQPELALQLQPYWDGANAQWWGGNPGAFCVLANYGGNRSSTGLTIDWFATTPKPDPGNLQAERSRQDYVSISPDFSVSARAQWEFADEGPVPIAVMGPVLKTSEKLVYDTIDWRKDWRNKTWSQAAPGIDAEQMLASYQDKDLLELQRMNSAYRMHFQTVSGSAELSQLIGHHPNGKNGYLGSTLEAPISAIATYEIPTAPVQSLAGFSGLRLQPGWSTAVSRQQWGTKNVNTAWWHKVTACKSGVPGVGVGNSFAVPMIPGDQIYQYHDISKHNPDSQIRGGGAPEDSFAFSDFWDHQLLVNDGLWDSWYSSSLADAQRPSDNAAESLPDLLDAVFNKREPLPNENFVPVVETPGADVIADLEKEDGYLRSAVYLVNRGAFNVNSTSVDAWYALFTGLREREAAYRDSGGRLEKIPVPEGMAVVTRYNTETAASESPDPRDGALVNGLYSWTGVRFLDDGQLRKLAGQCVQQVKKRGPFLNMSDFINRRLSNDALGARGALQAAIDYDDQAPDPQSINYRYKGSKDMVDAAVADLYPFPEAGKGSLFTGAPGYVVQSDILKPLGNALTVRDDSFRIRAYGEATDSNGKVLARAYCEATVQRTTAYVDPANDPTVPAIALDAQGNATGASPLTLVNQRFGRHLKIISFRWLSPNEI